MRNSEVVDKLTPRSPLEVIRRFVDQKETPTLTIYTTDGFTFCGIPNALEESRNEITLSLRLISPDLRSLSNDLVYIRGQRISHVKIHEFMSVAKTLSFGKIARNPEEPAPTRLQLRREIEELNLNFEKSTGLKLKIYLDWDQLPQSNSANLNLRDLVKALFKSLQTLTKDAIGRESLQSLKKISIENKDGAYLTMNREKTELIVQIDLEKALPGNLEGVVLKTCEKVL